MGRSGHGRAVIVDGLPELVSPLMDIASLEIHRVGPRLRSQLRRAIQIGDGGVELVGALLNAGANLVVFPCGRPLIDRLRQCSNGVVRTRGIGEQVRMQGMNVVQRGKLRDQVVHQRNGFRLPIARLQITGADLNDRLEVCGIFVDRWKIAQEAP